eukprot:PhF_6_TR15207/c0_g1_i1/m.23847
MQPHWNTSEVSLNYALYRPTIPVVMLEYILSSILTRRSNQDDAIVDLGCGSSSFLHQLVTTARDGGFGLKRWIGMDPSQTQLSCAPHNPAICYLRCDDT